MLVAIRSCVRTTEYSRVLFVKLYPFLKPPLNAKEIREVRQAQDADAKMHMLRWKSKRESIKTRKDDDRTTQGTSSPCQFSSA